MRYVALLRAVNVGGTGVITMKDVVALFEALGYDDVSTHGASGNVIYDGKGTATTHRKKIEAALSERLGKPATVMVRTATEMRAIVEEAPFADVAPDAKTYVAFLAEPVGAKMPPTLPGLPHYTFPSPRMGEVYLVRGPDDPPGTDVGKPLDKALGTAVTVRTFGVVEKLARKASQ